MKVGIDSVAHTAELLGLGEDLPRVPALALGAVEATPLSMLRAYSTIASGGNLLTPRVFDSLTVQGESVPLALGPKDEGKRVADPAPVFVLTDILKDVIEKGTAQAVRKLGFSAPAAGKTGTTNDARDAWFVGFTPQLLAVVWVGFDDNLPVGLTGGAAAVPIWTDFMKCALAGQDAPDFIPPEGVVFRTVDRYSGLLYEAGCASDGEIREVFVQGTEPVTTCLQREVENQPEEQSEEGAAEEELVNPEDLVNGEHERAFAPARKQYETPSRERWELKTDEGRLAERRRSPRREVAPRENRETDVWERLWNWPGLN
jgi:membrane carboxypeptidase/penicillin-binding protein